MSMITASAWVPKGYAAQFPEKYEFDQDEFDRITKLAQLHLEDAKEDLDEATEQDNASVEKKTSKNHSATNGNNDETADVPAEYNIDEYDEESDEDDDMQDGGGQLSALGNIKSLVYHDKDEKDPYITLPDNAEDEDDDEREELQILATDNLVLAGKVEDDVAHLEVYVYEDEADNLYVHHDIMLPAIPLAIEWIDTPVNKKGVDSSGRGNFVAVGTMEPDIEIWDLDTVDCMYPNAILGPGAEETEQAGTGKKKRKQKKARDDYHVDAVLALAANRQHRNLLASASADKTVKLWDLNSTKCAQSYKYHNDKVCTLAWHPQESTALLSGSYDKSIIAADMRAPESGVRTWRVESDLENVKWDPHDPNYFYASTESGILYYFDARKSPASQGVSSPVWRLQAHDEAVSAFDVNPIIPGFLATGSSDKQVKLWNVQPTGPSMVVTRDLDVGRVFSTTFAPDKEVGFRLAVAGSKGNMQIWDTSTNAAIRRAFAERVPAPSDEVIQERLVGLSVEEDESEDSDEEEDGDAMSANDDDEDEEDDAENGVKLH